MDSFSAFVIGFMGLAVFIILTGVKSVHQGREFTVERFGRYTHTLRPGLRFIWPIIDSIGAKINMMEQLLDVPSQDIITKDNVVVQVDGVVFFQVVDAAKAAYEINDLHNAILNLAITNIRNVMGSMDLEALLSKRDEINAKILTVVDEATTPWGVKVTRIEIKNIAPPPNIVEDLGRQLTADRIKRADILEAEGQRQSEILRAEGKKQAAILEAEGRREAAFRDAEARERAAQAEATATKMVSEAIASGDIQAINYFVAQKYVEAIKDMASADNHKVVFMPLESSSVIGSLGGIAELAKDAFKKES